MSSTKLAIVHNIIAPYRVPLFNKIASHEGVDLEVIFCSETENNRAWVIPNDMQFKYRVVGGFALPRHNGTTHISPRLLGHLIKSNPDLVVTSEFSVPSLFAISYCRVYKKNYVLWSDATAHSEHRVSGARRSLRRQLIKNSSACIASGSEACEYLISLGADPSRVKQSILTLDVERFSQECGALVPQKRHLKNRFGFAEKVILYSGRLVEQKGLIHLLEAYTVLKRWNDDTSLLLLGSGRLECQLRDYCLVHKLNVHFAGFVRQQELPMYYSLADVLVFPSLCDRWGIVVNEALAAGLPVVCSKYAGAAADLIEEGENGYIVDPEDIDMLAEKIHSILNDDRKRFKMRTRSKEMMKHCTIDRAACGFMSAINCVLSSTKYESKSNSAQYDD